MKAKIQQVITLLVPTLLFIALIGLPIVITKDMQTTATERRVAKLLKQPNTSNVPKPGESKKVGIYVTNEDRPTKIETQIQAKLSMIGWFATFKQGLESNKLTYACTNGYVPVITWEGWNGDGDKTNSYPLSGIAVGDFDAQIIQQLTDVKRACPNQTVIIRFDHEMDLPKDAKSWYPWQSQPTDYIAAHRHLVALSRKINPNVKYLWSPNRGRSYTADYYPGNDWVDYVGLTLNNATPTHSDWASFAAFYSDNQNVIESFNKPVIVSETGAGELLESNKADWMTGMFDYVASNPKIVGLVMLNKVQTYQTGEVADYRIDSSPAALQAVVDGIKQLRGGK